MSLLQEAFGGGAAAAVAEAPSTPPSSTLPLPSSAVEPLAQLQTPPVSVEPESAVATQGGRNVVNSSTSSGGGSGDDGGDGGGGIGGGGGGGAERDGDGSSGVSGVTESNVSGGDGGATLLVSKDRVVEENTLPEDDIEGEADYEGMLCLFLKRPCPVPKAMQEVRPRFSWCD